MKCLDRFNKLIDQKLVEMKLIKKPKPIMETTLSQFVQILLMNLNSGMILEKALHDTIDAIPDLNDLKTAMHMHQSAVIGFNHYAASLESDSVSRLSRTITQAHLTGSLSLEQSLEKMYETLWHEKINAFKKKSEKVSIQLTFLLMLSLISVIVVVVSPIILTL